MDGLSGQDILQVWEAGRGQKPCERALTILERAFPGRARAQLAGLPIGRRDELLFTARAATFGPRLQSLVECPVCGEQLEFGFEVSELGVAPGGEEVEFEPAEETRQLSASGYTVEFRLLTGADLEVCGAEGDLGSARGELARRCVRRVWREGKEVEADALPEEVVDALAGRVAESDPHALIEFNLDCPACGERWQTPFDIVAFFWAEIEAQARRLLREVHTLALAYGWREADILALSAARRQAYLEMVIE